MRNIPRPRGKRLLKVKAKDPEHRLGTIFVNPGGPGDTARDFAAEVPQAVPQSILDRFDIVGADPRGTDGSTPIQCFATQAPAAPCRPPPHRRAHPADRQPVGSGRQLQQRRGNGAADARQPPGPQRQLTYCRGDVQPFTR